MGWGTGVHSPHASSAHTLSDRSWQHGAGRGCQHIEVTIFLFPLPTDQQQLRCSSPAAACQPWHQAANCQVVIPASTQINHNEHLALSFMMPQWSVTTVTVNIFGATFSSHSTLPPYILNVTFSSNIISFQQYRMGTDLVVHKSMN